MFDNFYRRALLGLAGVGPIERFIRARGMRLGVARFVAGRTIDQAIEVARRLEGDGAKAILDLLGEFEASAEAARSTTTEIVADLVRLAAATASPAVSVKPTQLGLGVDRTLALDNARKIASCAADAGVQVCLDMENHPYVDGTLDLYRTLHAEGFTNVSTVLQSYLRRSESDLAALLELEPRPTLRIVKGAYREPPEMVFREKSRVDGGFERLVTRLLEAGGRANIATHDERLIGRVRGFVEDTGIPPDRYEFQMLYGVSPGLQRRLREAGLPLRIYVPYGEDWYGYFSRRLAERPANLAFVVRGLFG